MKIIIRESGKPYGFVRADDDIKTVQIDVMRSPEIPPGFPSSDIRGPTMAGCAFGRRVIAQGRRCTAPFILD